MMQCYIMQHKRLGMDSWVVPLSIMLEYLMCLGELGFVADLVADNVETQNMPLCNMI